MSARRYGQVCGVARSLDLIGERWTLLIVRELLLGPKRFGALAAALPGIGPNLLSARLSALAEADLIERVQLPAPAAVGAYALTDLGAGLREPVEALAVWGFGLLEPEREVAEGAVARGSLLAATLAAAAARRSGHSGAEGLTVNFDIDGERFFIRAGRDRTHVRHGRDDRAASELTCDLPTFYELTVGEREPADPAVASILAALAPAIS